MAARDAAGAAPSRQTMTSASQRRPPHQTLLNAEPLARKSCSRLSAFEVGRAVQHRSDNESRGSLSSACQ